MGGSGCAYHPRDRNTFFLPRFFYGGGKKGGIPMENANDIAFHVSKATMLMNLLLSAVKLAAGLIAHSAAMVSDAIHSASDVFSTVIVISGLKAAQKESDREHPYGHERMECVAALVLAMVLLITGLFIGYEGVKSITSQEPLPIPGFLALAAAVVSIVVKEGMYRYTCRAAKEIQSDALMADAWHHRSDALSSIGALIGIAGAKLGLPVLDPIASLVICLMIGKAAYDIFRDAVNKMVDQTGGEELEAEVRQLTLGQAGVKHIDRLQSRRFGNRVYIEMEISADGELPLRQSHAIAEAVHDQIEQALPQVKHIMIHVNPAETESA